MLLFSVSDALLRFSLNALNLCFQDLILTACFIELFSDLVVFLLFSLDSKPMPGFHVLGYFHSENIRIDGERQLIVHLFKLSLLLIDCTFHIVHALFLSELYFFASLGLLGQASLS